MSLRRWRKCRQPAIRCWQPRELSLVVFSLPIRIVGAVQLVHYELRTIAREHGPIFEYALEGVLQKVVRLACLHLNVEAIGVLRLRNQVVLPWIDVGETVGSKQVYRDHMAVGVKLELIREPGIAGGQ